MSVRIRLPLPNEDMMKKATRLVTRKDFALDPNFKSATPTATLTATRGTQTVVRKLYGPVTPERLAAEQKDVEYRAEQLNPVPKRPERIERVEGQFMNYGKEDYAAPRRKGRGVVIGA
jgi:hypothetical protein